ncbi:MAG: putative O-glycosylation ligase, exosortase A system-associated [Thiohalocapsa sp.]|jgi:probable O-glycosylation ligase (exosortase A-associated)|uniref:putative O-glycosylation ligase, exosortase A system-associated n=1 Tax=Thiohalocapsa sp. TaxID=2497641 RepID=UPI0025F2C5CF|nr:putative O-glycosylation ligase, exosortase A system-associated [Thiohalocapsa sp.]MCG6940124.1 putative O-glycosylation ligase, exosortase A system-associated [Thiohalocapsa sp.]
MGLRDIFLLVTIYGSVPFIYMKPFIGVLVWYWLSLMNPHRISWTLTNQPFAEIIALAMLSSLLIARKESKRIPISPITVTLALFWLWMLITTIFSLYPYLAWWQWDKVWKIMLTTYVAMIMLNSKERIISLTAVSALSIGFYGFKGGLFTILTGGGYKVWGPAGSFIGGNNEIGLALNMTIPLLVYLRSVVEYRVVKLALLVGVVLCVFAIFGTQSRGAFVGIAAMGLFVIWKTKNRVFYLLVAVVVGSIVFNFMPASWHERMETMETYQEDGSAMGRIKAWHMAFNLAMDRPLGGGFEAFKPATYLMYLPEVGARGTDAHSIYFETMGEHGFIGLALFLMIGFFSFRACGRIVRKTRGIEHLEWMNNLARLIQASLVGYAVSGLFLGLSYFDFYYVLVAIIVGMMTVLRQELQASEPLADAAMARAAGRVVPEAVPPGVVVASTSAFGRATAGSSQFAARARPLPPGKPLNSVPTVPELILLAKEWFRRL